MSNEDVKAAGMAVRRKILGDEYVDRAVARTNSFNREFQDMLTRYGWGEVWTRPGLDHRTRRILVMGTMVALGRYDEFRMHVRAALRAGLSLNDLKEVMLQQAIYCGLPLANGGFHAIEEVLQELRAEGVKITDDTP
ncbi:MAG: pcaC [Rhizobiaceae bacterium]|jgi:4-carboxymuconolactone decarboxylase|nr:pcaC [Rhizobiaceae bacterium]